MSHHRHWTGGMRADWRDIAGAFLAAQHGRSEDDRRGAGHGRGRWGGPRGGGRLLGHGDLRLLLLVLIGERPRHGYDLIRAIEERFAGAYTPSPGAVYPLLTLLEEQDLIRATPEGAKKLYAATPEGEAYLRENDAAVQGILTRVKLAATAYSSQTAPDTVWEAWKTLKQAINLPRAPWTEGEAQRIRAILERAAHDIVLPPANGD